MTDGEPAGLMAFWADIDSGYEPRFLEWHNCEHMPERVSVPGFREGRRYRDLGGLPRYLMMYFTESAGVLGSDAYTERLNHPTPWTRESLGHFRNPSRNVYSVLAEHGRTSPRESPYLISVRFDIAPEADARIRSSIRSALLPGWTALPNVGAGAVLRHRRDRLRHRDGRTRHLRGRTGLAALPASRRMRVSGRRRDRGVAGGVGLPRRESDRRRPGDCARDPRGVPDRLRAAGGMTAMPARPQP